MIKNLNETLKKVADVLKENPDVKKMSEKKKKFIKDFQEKLSEAFKTDELKDKSTVDLPDEVCDDNIKNVIINTVSYIGEKFKEAFPDADVKIKINSNMDDVLKSTKEAFDFVFKRLAERFGYDVSGEEEDDNENDGSEAGFDLDYIFDDLECEDDVSNEPECEKIFDDDDFLVIDFTKDCGGVHKPVCQKGKRACQDDCDCDKGVTECECKRSLADSLRDELETIVTRDEEVVEEVGKYIHSVLNDKEKKKYILHKKTDTQDASVEISLEYANFHRKSFNDYIRDEIRRMMIEIGGFKDVFFTGGENTGSCVIFMIL